MMTKEEYTNIVAFMTSRVGVVVLRYDHIADVMKCLISFNAYQCKSLKNMSVYNVIMK